MSDRLLEIKGLRAGYNGIPVVHGIDLTVDRGEVVALLGANGAGKTTSLLAISGVVKPLGGSVVLKGDDVAGQAPHKIARRGLVQVPEDRSLFFGLTTAQNLRLSERPGGADPWTLFPELQRLAKRPAGLLSGGEQQMLAVARAMAAGPTVLMVDEMSLGLAPVLVARLIPRLRQFADEQGIGVIMVEQHVRLALRHADRAYLMARGRIEAEGTATEMAEAAAKIEESYLGGKAS
ncbi:MAG: ABC transporter ATP-binding protein [Acidimicrobiia bacterium]